MIKLVKNFQVKLEKTLTSFFIITKNTSYMSCFVERKNHKKEKVKKEKQECDAIKILLKEQN